MNNMLHFALDMASPSDRWDTRLADELPAETPTHLADPVAASIVVEYVRAARDLGMGLTEFLEKINTTEGDVMVTLEQAVHGGSCSDASEVSIWTRRYYEELVQQGSQRFDSFQQLVASEIEHAKAMGASGIAGVMNNGGLE